MRERENKVTGYDRLPPASRAVVVLASLLQLLFHLCQDRRKVFAVLEMRWKAIGEKEMVRETWRTLEPSVGLVLCV